MGCILENEGKDTFALLQFDREQLLYDIRNNCYVEGHIMQQQTGTHVRHTVQDVGEEGNVDRVTRVLDLAVAEVREMLYPYTKHKPRRRFLDDRLLEKKAYGVLMKIPPGFSQTTLNLLERLIHEYLVCKACADWLSITHTEKSQVWLMKAEEAKNAIRESLTARMGRTRIRMHPF